MNELALRYTPGASPFFFQPLTQEGTPRLARLSRPAGKPLHGESLWDGEMLSEPVALHRILPVKGPHTRPYKSLSKSLLSCIYVCTC